MKYCLQIQNSNENKICVDADNKKSATRYFCKYEHLSKEILTQLFRIVENKNPSTKQISK